MNPIKFICRRLTDMFRLIAVTVCGLIGVHPSLVPALLKAQGFVEVELKKIIVNSGFARRIATSGFV